MNTFIFIGTPVISDKKDKKGRPTFNPVYTKEGSSWDTGKVKFAVKQSKNNIAFVEVGGGKPLGNQESKYPISTFDSDFNKIEIKWADRFKEDVIDNVSFARQYKTNVSGQTHTFITEYDMRLHLSEYLPKLDKETKIKVTGQVKSNEYNGSISQVFSAQNVWLAEESDKPSSMIEMDLLYNAENVEERSDEKIIDIVAYYEDYFGKDDGNMYVPLTLTFNGTKLDMSNELHKKMWESRVEMLEPNTDNFVKARWAIKYINGAEEVEFTEDMLTDAQRTEIEVGMATLEDFRPRNGAYGDNKVEFRLVKPILKKVGKSDFTNGYIDTELTDEEFMMKVRRPQKTQESIEEMESTNDDIIEVDDLDDDDLF